MGDGLEEFGASLSHMHKEVGRRLGLPLEQPLNDIDPHPLFHWKPVTEMVVVLTVAWIRRNPLLTWLAKLYDRYDITSMTFDFVMHISLDTLTNSPSIHKGIFAPQLSKFLCSLSDKALRTQWTFCTPSTPSLAFLPWGVAKKLHSQVIASILLWAHSYAYKLVFFGLASTAFAEIDDGFLLWCGNFLADLWNT